GSERPGLDQAAFASLPSVPAEGAAGLPLVFFTGTRIIVAQFRQRTVFPRELDGTISTFRHVRFGHMMRTLFSVMGVRGLQALSSDHPGAALTAPAGASPV